MQLWDYGSGRLIASFETDSYSSLLYVGKYITNMHIACGGCNTELFRIVDLRSHSVSSTEFIFGIYIIKYEMAYILPFWKIICQTLSEI